MAGMHRWCHLKGSGKGDAIHAVLCAAGYNIRWLLRMIGKKGLGLLLCLLQAAGLTALMVKFAQMFSQQWLKRSDQRWVLA
jgi:IS5 family transposase